MQQLTIGEVARQAGVRPSAIRYYERRGLLPVPARVNGRRRFDPAIVQRLVFIQYAKRVGFRLDELGGLWRALTARRGRATLRAKRAELEDTIARIRVMQSMLERGLECACRERQDCIVLDRTWWPADFSRPRNATAWR